MRNVFENVLWRRGGDETSCGSGSTKAYTRDLRAKLPQLLAKYDIKSIFDLGCGDFNWFNHVNLRGITYTGGDVNRKLIAENTDRYPQHTFIEFDGVKDIAPEADLTICRFVMLHLSEKAIIDVLNGIDSKYLLATTSPINRNDDAPAKWAEWAKKGNCRQVNLQIEPFNLGIPLEVIPEQLDYNLGLWKLR